MDTMTAIGRLLLLLLVFVAIPCCRSAEQENWSKLLVGIEDHPKTLDPRYATDAYGERISHNLLFSTLVQQDYDLQIIPDLAERFETPDDTTYVFHLRPDVFFHDGERMSAEDVRFTFDHLMDPAVKSPFGARLRGEIESVEVMGPLAVRFKLKQPVASFLTSSAVMPILPMHVLQRQSDSQVLTTGSGPFKFVSQTSTEIELAPNERYYGEAPRIERLVFKVIGDDNTRFLKMRKGELDLLINVVPVDKIEEVGKPPLSNTYHVVEEPGVSCNYVAFNMESPLFRDVRVRRAVAHGIDVDEIIAYRLGGHAVRATGLLSPVNPFREADVPVHDHDPDKARLLLDEAGYPDPDGNGPAPRLQIELKAANNPQAQSIVRILQAQLAGIGIQLDIRTYEWGTFYGDVRSGNFQMTTMRWVGIIDPDFYYDVFHSSRTPPNGSNRGRYADAEVDRLLEKGRSSPDHADRKAAYGQVQNKLASDLPYIYLWHINNISVIHNRVIGYRQHPTGGFQSFKSVVLK